MRLSIKQFQMVMWLLTAAVVLVSLLAWGQGLRWNFDQLDAYLLFPLFGLLAFGLMWSHYIVAAMRKLLDYPKRVSKLYFESTSIVVLVCILLHPGLLILQLYADGLGLPPNSYLENYVASGLKWAALLGSISLVIFLLFELHRWYGEKPWWQFVQYACDIAMVFILIHGFKLGGDLQSGWFQVVWIFYALTYVASLGIMYLHTSDKGDQ